MEMIYALIAKIKKFCKEQPVLIISFLAAIITILFVPPDKQYLSYCNRTVLIQLFCLMLSVSGLRSVGLFETATAFLLKHVGNIRKLGLVFVLICFFTSMFVTNDVALLTFVPLTLLVYNHISDERSRILTIVLETAAANLGSMLTPFGNPQNLYIYDMYRLTMGDFFRTMLPAGIVSLTCLLLLCMLLPGKPCTARTSGKESVSGLHCTVYLGMFILCLLTVFRIVPDWCCLAAAAVITLAVNRKLFLKVDYALLATFVCFFVFVGNISRIDSVRTFFSDILGGREMIVSALLSQIISNVPAAVMLSGFTENGTSLLLGVNLGGLGTIIASLASLISFQIYRKSENSKPGKYLLVFSAVNFGMLFLLMIFTGMTG